MFNILDFLNSKIDFDRNNFESSNINAVATAIANYKMAHFIPIEINHKNQERFVELISLTCEADKKIKQHRDNYFLLDKSSYVVTLSHIINPQRNEMDEAHQFESLKTLIDFKSVEGLQWFMAVGFNPAAQNSDHINALQYLAQQPEDAANLEMACLLIGAKKNNIALEKERERRELQKRTVEGKEIPELENEIADLMILALRNKKIDLCEFAASDQDFSTNIKAIFANDARTLDILTNFKEQYGEERHLLLVQQLENANLVHLEDIILNTQESPNSCAHKRSDQTEFAQPLLDTSNVCAIM